MVLQWENVMCNNGGFCDRIIQTACLISLVMLVGCKQIPNTNKYFSFPISEIEIPDISDTLDLKQVCDSDWTYQAWYIDDKRGIFLLPIVYADSTFVTIEEIPTGAEHGRYCIKGRGPQEFLSPIASDYCDGGLCLFDLMTNRYSELDIASSVAQGRSVFTRIVSLDYCGEDYLTLFSIHKWKDVLLAYDMGQNPMSQSLTRSPDYVLFNLENGEKVKNLNLIQNVPLSDRKREKNMVPVKSRMGAADYLDADSNRMCFAMYSIPQLNIVNLETGVAKGLILKERKNTSFQKGYRHYHDVTATRDLIFALYFGEEETKLLSGETKTELHVYDWEGNFLVRCLIPYTVNSCQASAEGLYVTRFSNNSYKLNIIPWDQIPV